METTVKKPNFMMRYLDKRLTTSQFTAKQIISLYIPMLLDQFSVYVIDIIGAALVSASSEEAISAMSLVSSIAYMVTSLFGAIGVGGSVLVAQAKGRGNEEEIKKVCAQTVTIALFLSVIATAFLVGFADPIVNTLFSETSDVIREYGITYLRLYGMSFIPFAVYAVIINCFRGMGEAKKALVLTLVINITYLICSFIFINGLKLGIAGTGISFIIARIIGGGTAFFMLFVFCKRYKARIRDMFHISKDYLKRILTLAFPFAIEQILFYGGSLINSTIIATLNQNSIAAHSIANSLFNMFLMGGQALMSMLMTICGQCIGAKNYDLAKHYTKQVTRMGRFVVVINTAFAFAIMPLLMLLYKPSAAAEPLLYQLLIVGAAANIALYCTGYLTPACLRSAGDATYTTVISLIAVWTARVVFGYLLAIVCGFGIHAVWATYFIEYGIRTVCFHQRLKGKKWIKM